MADLTDRIDVHSIQAINHAEAWHLATTEYHRYGSVLDSLTDEEWTRPTDCAAWDVRRLAAHVLGATEANGYPVEMIRQLRRGREGTAVGVDRVSAVQVRDRDRLAPAEIISRYHRAVPSAVRWRHRYVRAAGRVPFRVGAPIQETWPLAYLADVIYTRDTWMHRLDTCRATARAPVLTADHDGRIVADVVADWARRHGEPFRLDLDGDAGGHYRSGTGGVSISLDALEFCRVLSGRGHGRGLLATTVPF